MSRTRRPRRCQRCREPFVPAATGRRRLYCSTACRVAAYKRRRRRSVHFSSRTPEWATPPDVFAALDAEFGFDLDPCATAANAKCSRYFTEADDGLAQHWTGRVFMNPPYGGVVGRWVAKAWRASRNGADVVVCLVPARTDTRWWHDYATRGEIRFLRGRLHFGDAKTGAPFPSAVVVFRNPLAGNETADESRVP